MHDILGPLPDFLAARWARAGLYFDEQGRKIRHYVGSEAPTGNDGVEVALPASSFVPLEEFFDRERNPDLTPEDAAVVKGLLRRILAYDEKQRPTAAELLKHSWFASDGDGAFLNPVACG
jgi:serine/threonine protein kinase